MYVSTLATWSFYLCTAILSVTNLATAQQQEQPPEVVVECNENESILKFSVVAKDDGVGDDYFGDSVGDIPGLQAEEKIFWRVVHSNGTILQECEDELSGCELLPEQTICIPRHGTPERNESLVVDGEDSAFTDSPSSSPSCHQLQLFGIPLEDDSRSNGEVPLQYSLLASLDGVAVADVFRFQNIAVNLGEDCYVCDETNANIELFLETTVVEPSYVDGYDNDNNNATTGVATPHMISFLVSNPSMSVQGYFSNTRRHHYMSLCVSKFSCNTIKYSLVPLDGNYSSPPTSPISGKSQIFVDGVLHDQEDNVWLEAQSFGFSAVVGNCISSDAWWCGTQLLLTVRIKTGKLFRGRGGDYWDPWQWRTVHGTTPSSKDSPPYYISDDWNVYDYIADSEYQIMSCIEGTECTSLVYENGYVYPYQQEDVQVQAFIDRVEFFVDGTCETTSDALSQEYCNDRYGDFGGDRLSVIPLGGDDCPRRTAESKLRLAGLIIIPVVLVSIIIGVTCYCRKYGHITGPSSGAAPINSLVENNNPIVRDANEGVVAVAEAIREQQERPRTNDIDIPSTKPPPPIQDETDSASAAGGSDEEDYC